MSDRKFIYLAGPDVFFPDALAVGARKKQLCARFGFDGLFPLDNDAAPGTTERALRIYDANVGMMRRAHAGIFNLTPFRGPSADPGTVFELGLMLGLGKQVFAYTTDGSDLRERVPGTRYDAAVGEFLDPAGLTVEDFGLGDNLMLDCALAGQGHPLVRGAADWVAGFKACLAMAATAFDVATP